MERKAAQEGSFKLSVKRNIQRKSRKFKLGVLCDWKYALVPRRCSPPRYMARGGCGIPGGVQQWYGTGHNIISKSFRQLGMALPIDCSCDKELNVKGLDSLGVEDRTRTKKGEGGELGEGEAGPMVRSRILSCLRMEMAW